MHARSAVCATGEVNLSQSTLIIAMASGTIIGWKTCACCVQIVTAKRRLLERETESKESVSSE